MRQARCCAPLCCGTISVQARSVMKSARIGLDRLIQITGNDALTGFTAPKILWMQEHEPDIYAKARQILLPHDFIRFMLTGGYGIDRAGGAGMGLFDLKARTWSPEVL